MEGASDQKFFVGSKYIHRKKKRENRDPLFFFLRYVRIKPASSLFGFVGKKNIRETGNDCPSLCYQPCQVLGPCLFFFFFHSAIVYSMFFYRTLVCK